MTSSVPCCCEYSMDSINKPQIPGRKFCQSLLSTAGTLYVYPSPKIACNDFATDFWQVPHGLLYSCLVILENQSGIELLLTWTKNLVRCFAPQTGHQQINQWLRPMSGRESQHNEEKILLSLGSS